MPGCAAAMSAAAFTSASMSRPGEGLTWIVTSRATSDCHSVAVARMRTTAPRVRAARKVMMAITATRARPAMLSAGTMDRWFGGTGAAGISPAVGSACSCGSLVMAASLIDVHPAFVQHQAARVEQVHQRDVVGGDDHRGAGLVELDEQPEQAARQHRVDVAGRLVGQQQLRAAD